MGANNTAYHGTTLHRVELVQEGGTLFVFGAEGYGAYLEALDMTTGRHLYQFCSGYWYNWSEKWDLR